MKAIRPGYFVALACALVLAIVLGVRSSARIESWDWTISGMSPPGNTSDHTTETVNFASSHWILMHRVASGSDDSVTVWGKNGYQSTLVGSTSDAATFYGSGDYEWDTYLYPAGTVAFGNPPRQVGVWWKSTYKTNVMSQEALVTKHSTGQNAYYSASISIIP